MFRQGDLLIVREDWSQGSYAERVRPVENGVVEVGEATGHAHVLEGGFVGDLHGQKVLRSDGEARLERIDVESVIERVLDSDGEDRLVAINGAVYLHLKDSSTPRRYLLQVPPEMERVRQAKAWTFDVTEEEYAPLIET